MPPVMITKVSPMASGRYSKVAFDTASHAAWVKSDEESRPKVSTTAPSTTTVQRLPYFSRNSAYD